MHMALTASDLSPEEVRQRFAWARRQGAPAWLWPDITIEAWQQALAGIETVTRAALAGGTSLLEGDPAAIGLAGYTSGMGALLGWWHQQGLVETSPDIAAVLDLHLRHNVARAARMEASAAAVVAALRGAGIAVAVLKGAHTAGAYFPHPGTRPASDIDLLVRGCDRAAAEAVLEAIGFTLASRGALESSWRRAGVAEYPRSLEFVHAEDPWTIDLHHTLDVFVSAGVPIAALDRAEPLSSTRPWAASPGAVVLEQPLLLLHLAVHAGSALQSLTLLRQVELVLVIRHDVADARLSWDAFIASAARCDALGFAYPALRLCEELAPGTVPHAVLDQLAAAAPPRMLRIVNQLAPASAHRVVRSSVGEHFMWTRGWRGWLRQLAADVAPTGISWRRVRAIYEARGWRLIRGRFSR
jgi:hypothetical protein